MERVEIFMHPVQIKNVRKKEFRGQTPHMSPVYFVVLDIFSHILVQVDTVYRMIGFSISNKI